MNYEAERRQKEAIMAAFAWGGENNAKAIRIVGLRAAI
jgi:hypothetical protein